jgi:hypothetical protein
MAGAAGFAAGHQDSTENDNTKLTVPLSFGYNG